MPVKTTGKADMDRTDHRIVAELQRDGRLTVTELASRVGISKSPCQVRLKRLIASGVIRGYRAVVDPRAVGREHVAFNLSSSKAT